MAGTPADVPVPAAWQTRQASLTRLPVRGVTATAHRPHPVGEACACLAPMSFLFTRPMMSDAEIVAASRQ